MEGKKFSINGATTKTNAQARNPVMVIVWPSGTAPICIPEMKSQPDIVGEQDSAFPARFLAVHGVILKK